jgi:hypothetical protein
MRGVIERGIKVFIQALKNMEDDGVLPQWQWDTDLSCEDRSIKRWKGGELLYE